MTDESEENGTTSKRASDLPAALLREREQFVRTFLRKGVEYTEELLHENQELRVEILQLQNDNARLRAQVASDDAIKELLRTVEGLETERQALLEKSETLEAGRAAHEGRTAEIENEFSDLANLYIATHQLHASLTVPNVVRQLKDMVGQLVGAHAFVIYVLDRGAGQAVPVAYEALLPEDLAPVSLEGTPLGDVCLVAIPKIRKEGSLTQGSLDDPLAIIPLLADGCAVGVISIVSLLGHKTHWADVDRELFKLLGAQAGAALIAANLYADITDPGSALANLGDKL